MQVIRTSLNDDQDDYPARKRQKVSRKRAALAVVVDVPGSAADPDEPLNRQEIIATADYYLAEQRGFSEGGDVEDWLAAEDEVEQYLSGAGLTRFGDIP